MATLLAQASRILSEGMEGLLAVQGAGLAKSRLVALGKCLSLSWVGCFSTGLPALPRGPKRLGLSGIGADFEDHGGIGQFAEIGGVLHEEIVHAPEFRERLEAHRVAVLDDVAGVFREVAQGGDVGEDLATAIVDDDDADLWVRELRQDPGRGEIVEGAEVAENEPGLVFIRGGHAEEGGDEAVDAVGAAIGVKMDALRRDRHGEVPLANGQAVAEEDACSCGKSLMKVMHPGRLGKWMALEVGLEFCGPFGV